MKSSIKTATIVLTATILSLGILTEVKPARSQSAPLPNTQQSSPQQTPEPGTIIGLLLTVLGGLFVKKQIDETKAPADLPNQSNVESNEINSEENLEE